MTGAEIAARALQQVGTPFLPFGRSPGVALDCVGLVAHSVGMTGQWQYGLKGNYFQTIASALKDQNFRRCDDDAKPEDGDIALVQCAPRQQHLMIRAAHGWVHAHAGLGRVVHLPGVSPWPMIANWRFAGE